MSTLAHDLKIALRTIKTKPGFSLMVIGMLVPARRALAVDPMKALRFSSG